ncbi:MAG TPA: D-alanyl-D-alanine carboxypeptidase/D-alanyl-D-alanine-endopeptidase [Tepidisphaeraceae bacterium]|jgi:D-alanyl-D-alanine carboxypeptidase/D-alanyl-D-alanine-endopeptidase (penicillin-binding protein 4)|nr:D-alanyl-D-alanine carboxypeptidase/D-alanyl-D-alanine-endopeptidase [Tepidisphaeraceae bacterium]
MKQITTTIFCAVLSISTVVFADIDSDVNAVLADKLLAKSTVGVEIVALGDSPADSRVLLRRGAATPLIPASNLKLITTAAAVEKFGAGFRFETRFVKHGQNVIVVGDGDPTLGDTDLIKKFGQGSTSVFTAWAAALKDSGTISVQDVIVDDSIFDGQFVHPNWPEDQRHLRYVAGVAGLNLNANCLDFYLSGTSPGARVNYRIDPPTQYVQVENNCITRSGDSAVSLLLDPETKRLLLRGYSPGSTVAVSVTVDDPSLYAATVLKEQLAQAGITVNGTVRREHGARAALAAGSPDYTVVSRYVTSIEYVLDRANKDSVNLYAEALCKRLGFADTNAPGSWVNGPAAMGKFLSSVGVPPDQYTFDDGCGLSKQNAISAGAISAVLQHMYFSPNRQAFLSSLSVAGVDGTLDSRFRGSDLRNRVFAKSGFVNGVSTLSGYFMGKDDRWYAFSILMNGIPNKSNSSIKPLQERIVKAADDLTR